MLKQDLVSGAVGAGDGPGAEPRSRQARRRLQQGLASWRGLLRRNRLLAIALGLAVLPRVVVMVGFQPAILFKLDTYDYLWDAVHLIPNLANSGGYSLFLVLLEPFHSLTLIVGLQHVLGLVVAVMAYAVMRRWGVRPWLAVLATLPMLFSPSEFLLEQLIMADFLALLLLIAALAVLLLRQEPSVRRTVTAGMLMGASAVVRPTALPLIAVMALYLLVRRAGWRRVCAVLVGGGLPVAMYMAWFAMANGSFNITNSSGLFLWSRTMSFANCQVIKPPANLRALCPSQQRTIPDVPPSQRAQPKIYLWNHAAWQWKTPRPPGLVPDMAAFTAANNARAMHFAILAIKAQPLAFAGVIGRDTLHAFIKPNLFVFPGASGRTATLGPRDASYALAAVKAYTGSTGSTRHYLGVHFGEHVIEPYAQLITGYQKVIYLPGPLFGVILLVGLIGILIPRRRLAASGMLLASAVITVLLPIVEHEYNYRYVIPAVPLACMAAALAFRDRSGHASAGATSAGPRQAGQTPAGPEPLSAEPAWPEPPSGQLTGPEPLSAELARPESLSAQPPPGWSRPAPSPRRAGAGLR